VIKSSLVIVLLAGCSGWNGGTPLDANNACPADAEQIGTVTFTAGQTVLPVTGDLAITGTYAPPAGIQVSEIFVEGVAATAVGADISNFTVTVPFAAVQSAAARGRTPQTATLQVTAVTSCSNAPLPIGQLIVPVQALTTLSIAPLDGSPSYLPTTKSVPEPLEIVANPEAVGETITVTTSQGTVSGAASAMVALSGDGVDPATGTVLLLAGSSDGVADVTAQGLTAGSLTIVYAAGPPQFAPPTSGINAGDSMTVALVSSLPPSLLVPSIIGCTATADPQLSATTGSATITGLTPLAKNDQDQLLEFTITAGSTAAGSATITVTCFDQFAQSSSATYTVN
jgi:hypothetical protein